MSNSSHLSLAQLPYAAHPLRIPHKSHNMKASLAGRYRDCARTTAVYDDVGYGVERGLPPCRVNAQRIPIIVCGVASGLRSESADVRRDVPPRPSSLLFKS